MVTESSSTSRTPLVVGALLGAVAALLLGAILLLRGGSWSLEGGAKENEAAASLGADADSDRERPEPLLSKRDGATAVLSPLDSQEVEVRVEKVSDLSLAKGIDATVHLVEVQRSDEKTAFDFHSEVRIPYDADKIADGQKVRDCVVAAHYNAKTENWDPVLFELDTQAEVAIVSTKHFSLFGVFTFENEGKRNASVSIPPSVMIGGLPQVDYQKIFSDMAAGDESSALEAGLGVVNNPINFGGHAVTVATEPAKMLDPLAKWPRVDKLGNALLGVGVALAAVQLVVDYQSEGKVGAKTLGNAIKNASYLAVSKFGTSAMKLKSAGFFMIDYSLNAFGTEAWDSLEAKHQRLYKNYYTRTYGGEVGQQSHLLRKVYDAYQQSLGSSGGFDLRKQLDDTFKEHCSEFWKQSALEHVDDMRQASDTWFSSLPASKQEKVSSGYCGMLLSTVGRAIGETMVQRIGMDLRQDYLQALERVRNELNTEVVVTIEEPRENQEKPAKYAEHQLRFAPLSEAASVSSWSGKLRENGQARTTFTIAGYISAGAPTTLRVFEPAEDPSTAKPVLEVPFSLDKRELTILLSEKLEMAGIYRAIYPAKALIHAELRKQGVIPVSASDASFTLTVSKDNRMRVQYRYNYSYLMWENDKTPNAEDTDADFEIPVSHDGSFHIAQEGAYFKGRIVPEDGQMVARVEMREPIGWGDDLSPVVRFTARQK